MSEKFYQPANSWYLPQGLALYDHWYQENKYYLLIDNLYHWVISSISDKISNFAI